MNEKWTYSPVPSLTNTKHLDFSGLVTLKNENKLRSSGPTVTFERGLGLVSSSKDDKEYLKHDNEKENIAEIALSSTTVTLCNTLLQLPSPRDVSIPKLFSHNAFDQSDHNTWIMIVKNEERASRDSDQDLDLEPTNHSKFNFKAGFHLFSDQGSRLRLDNQDDPERVLYDCQLNFRQNSQYFISKQSYIQEITFSKRFIAKRVDLQDDMKMKYTAGRATKEVLFGPGGNIGLLETKTVKINENFCDDILSKRENFLFCFNVLKNILSFVIKLRRKIKSEYMMTRNEIDNPKTNQDAQMTVIAWRTILQNDQRKYKVKESENFPKINEVVCVTLRVENICRPIIDGNSELFRTIVAYVHKNETGDTKFTALHLHNKTCLEIVFGARIGLYCGSMKKKVGDIIKNCHNCRRTRLQDYTCPIGPRYSLTSPVAGLFACISLDPAFQITIKNFPGGRKSCMLTHIMLATCLNTGCSDNVILRGMKNTDISLAIRTLEVSHNTKVNLIFTDRGSNVRKELLEESGSWTVVNHVSSGQSRNYSETKVRLGRRIWRAVFRMCKDESGKFAAKIDFVELLYLAKLVSLSINLIPYSRVSSETQGFCPANILHGRALTEAVVGENDMIDFASSPPLSKYKDFLEKILQVRNEVLVNLATEASGRNHNYKLRNQSKMKINEGDVVLWEHGNNKYNLAVVLMVYPSPSVSAKIRYSGVKEPKDVKIGSLKVLVPFDSVEAQYLGSRSMDAMSQEISRAVESAKEKVV